MPRFVLLSLGLLIGAALPVQAGVNSQLRQVVGSPYRAGLISVLVSSLTLGVVSLMSLGLSIQLRESAWWMWLGGVLGAAFVTGSIVLAPRLGATTLVAAVVAGQLSLSVVLDHFGLLGYPVAPISWPRVLGIVLLVAGVLLIQRR
jgi:transporter family-2 protein